jgi:hypothetical protein
MKPALTTITPYWQRPEMLRGWVKAVKGASIPEVQHFVYFVGEGLPDWWYNEVGGYPIYSHLCPEAPGRSIGHYHNIGAEYAETPWIMKMDVDTIPHVNYFKRLLPVLRSARPREWFNGGMIYISQASSLVNLREDHLPLSEKRYQRIMGQLRVHRYASGVLSYPQATNFICRVEDYSDCDGRFLGYGWEDYHQIYMLEHRQQGRDPLPGELALENVTARCRDEIARRKAGELFARDSGLCLFHRWHSPGAYKDREQMLRNRDILLETILAKRS